MVEQARAGGAEVEALTMAAAWSPIVAALIGGSMSARTIESIADIVSAADAARAELRCISRAVPIWFRGQAASYWSLRPSLWREFSERHEGDLVTLFRHGAMIRRRDCPPLTDAVQWLCLMQHYGLPTRMLDWTKSPLVAAFFAVLPWDREEAEPDATLWALDPLVLNNRQADCCRFYDLADPEVRHMLGPVWTGGGTVQEQRLKAQVVAGGAPQYDSRMLLQHSVFTLHTPEAPPLDEMEHSEHFLVRFTIPKERKHALRNELAELEFRASNLFPDLAHLANDVTDMVRRR